MFIAIPEHGAAISAILSSAAYTDALVSSILANDSEDPALLHIRDREAPSAPEAAPSTSSWNAVEELLQRACVCWWAARAKLDADRAVGIALTRRKNVDGSSNDDDMEMFVAGDKVAQKTAVIDMDAFVQDIGNDVQVVQATMQDDYYGMSTTQPLTGHLAGSLLVSPLDVLNEDTRCKWFKTEETNLHDVLLHIDFEKPVNVVGMNVGEAAIVAMALVLDGHTDVRLCSFELTVESIANLPAHLTGDMFAPSSVHLSTEGIFDISNTAHEVVVDEDAKSSLLKEYTEASNAPPAKKEEEVQIEPQDYQAEFFTMPSPLSKERFLAIARVIQQYSSLVLAPYGVLCANPNPNVTNSFILELKLKCGPILQEVVETVSDLVYETFGVNESTMAMSSQKWLNEVRDRECVEQMQTINELPTTLMKPPAIVDLGTNDPEQVPELLEKIRQRIGHSLQEKVSWALKAPPVHDFSKTPTPLSSMTWYPSTVYQLGYKFTPRAQSTKQSSLQVKAKIQAVYEGVREAIDGAKLDAVQLQALVDSQPADIRAEADRILAETFASHHVVNDDVFVDNELTDEAAELFASKLRQGDVHGRRQEDEEALKKYTEAMNYVPLFHPLLADALTKRAKWYFKHDRLDLALADCTLALEVSPFCMDAFACKGEIAEAKKEYEEALQNHVLAFILGGSRVVEQAETIERVSKHVGREQAKNIWATMIMRHELPSKWLIDSYFQSFSRDVDAGISLRGITKESLDKNAIEGNFEQFVLRAIDHKRSQRYNEAQSSFKALTEFILQGHADAEDLKYRVVALNLHATFLYITGDVSAALEIIQHALDLDATNVNSVIKKAGFLCELGDFEGAEACFQEAAELDSNSSDIYLHQGQMELIIGEYPSAVATLRRSLTRCDSLPVTHISYGMALYKAGSHYQSMDVFKTALEQFPNSHEVRLFYGDVLSDRADYGQAMQHLKKAFEFSPQCPLPWLNAGRIFVATNDGNHAISHFEQALQVDNRCSAAHLDLAQVYFAQGQVDKAFQHFDQAIQTCRFLPEVEDACACRCVATMQLHATTILGVELRHMLKSKK